MHDQFKFFVPREFKDDDDFFAIWERRIVDISTIDQPDAWNAEMNRDRRHILTVRRISVVLVYRRIRVSSF